MTSYPTVAIPTTLVDLPIGVLGEPQDVIIPIARRRWLKFIAKVILGSVGLAVIGAVLSLFFNILSLLAVSGFLLFFAGAVALAARDKLTRKDIVGRDDEQELARVIPRSN